jgi:hypothetical protein
MTDPKELDEGLRMEADRLLAAGLLDALVAYGEPRIVGSYSLCLMAWRDLDIEVVREPFDRRAFFDLGHRISECLTPPRMHYRDETVARTPGLPSGLYWGICLGDERKGAWKIDIWSVDRLHAESQKIRAAELARRLTPETRRVIITLKEQVWSDLRYRRAFSSQDLYECVLDHGVRDLAALFECLSSQGKAG